MNTLTLNQVVKVFQDIATAHYQLNSFGFGDIWEFNTSGTTLYPTMWLELVPGQRLKNETDYRFNLYVMDLVRNGEGDETEVLSDTAQIIEDVIAELEHPSYTFAFNGVNISLTPFTEKRIDLVAGWLAPLSIRIIKPNDRCAIPQGSITRI